MSADELIGKVALQAVPAGIGAILAAQLGIKEQKQEERARGYLAELVYMLVGFIWRSIWHRPTRWYSPHVSSASGTRSP